MQGKGFLSLQAGLGSLFCVYLSLSICLNFASKVPKIKIKQPLKK
jgi:hypothetical protein